MREWTRAEAILDALAKNPECSHAETRPGLDFLFNPTIVVELWRNEECWAANDPPKFIVEGYYPGRGE